MSKAKKNYSFRFKEWVMSDLQKIADKQNRTTTNLIETILINFTENEQRISKTK